MMLGPVELNAAGNPGPVQADESGLNHVVFVDKVVVVDFPVRMN